jgi:hypothetical protein
MQKRGDFTMKTLRQKYPKAVNIMESIYEIKKDIPDSLNSDLLLDKDTFELLRNHVKNGIVDIFWIDHSKYPISKFIEELSVIPEEDWGVGPYTTPDGKKDVFAMLGGTPTEEPVKLMMFRRIYWARLRIFPACIYDGEVTAFYGTSNIFDPNMIGRTPKERIINSLYLMSQGGDCLKQEEYIPLITKVYE